MKQSVFITTLLIVSLVLAYIIYEYMLPKFIQDGGPLVVALICLTIMVTTFIIERIFSLRKAQGRGALTVFLKNVTQEINKGNIDGAISACDKQRGSCANIIRTGLERYKMLSQEGDVKGQKEMMADVQHAIEEAMMLEVPLLEKNLVALSTIASISTMVGLLGTVLGMIRSFAAMSRAGAPDAVQLALGISEALINTAGGLIAAIAGILAYNFFTTKVDNFTYMIDEASYSIVQSLAVREPKKSK
ncbi:MAG: MotA/TolQ/ExbB proton channel family protein [Ignavibacteriales bacterium]|nr:MotA/TolQ/ExbB proton channel family protein [Ignavibacteriales bacterium]MBI3787252.1 MotA/TolQ/ExbB proton channel family protein [Ignavibacteriales bacterium]